MGRSLPTMRFATVVVLAGLAGLSVVTGCKKPAPPPMDAGVVAPVADAAPPPADASASLDEVVDAAAALSPAVVDAGHHAVAAAAPIPFVAGETWNGTYNCGANNTMALKITAVAGNHVSAVFDFKMHNKKTGGFTMSGTYEPAAKHLLLTAGNWIEQPKGVVTVNLDGTVGEDKHSYAGKVVGPNCFGFSSRR